MQAADEDLIQVYQRYTKALHDRDVPTILEMSIDDPEGSYFGIGSPPNEERTLGEWKGILGTFPPVAIIDSDFHGYVEGDVAWFRAIMTAELPGDPKKERVRQTMVLRRVDGEWKVVQWHASQPVAHRWIPGEANDPARRS